MTLSGRYFVPGPVEVDDAVAQAMLRPMIPHRGTAGKALVARVQPGLQRLFGTERPVLLATCSATAMMEAAIRSGVRERVLCVVGGLFGERFAEVAERCDKEVVRLVLPRGGVLEPSLLDELADGPVIDAVTMIHCETSTGALAPIAELIARWRQERDVLTLVDAVSSLGGVAIETDQWQPDFIFSSSQKALGLPPGLAFGVVSERLLQRAREFHDRGFYLDLVDLHEAAVESRFPQTPALPIVNALDVQLERIDREGLAARFARHREMQQLVEQWVATDGRCSILAPVDRRSTTVTAIDLGPDQSAVAMVRTLSAEGWELSAGLGTDTDRVIRIGHMGDLQPTQLAPLLHAIEPLL